MIKIFGSGLMGLAIKFGMWAGAGGSRSPHPRLSPGAAGAVTHHPPVYCLTAFSVSSLFLKTNISWQTFISVRLFYNNWETIVNHNKWKCWIVFRIRIDLHTDPDPAFEVNTDPNSGNRFWTQVFISKINKKNVSIFIKTVFLHKSFKRTSVRILRHK